MDGFLPKKEPRVFCLLRKDFWVAPRRRTFSFPRRGQIFLIWNGFPILSTWVSWEMDQGSWNPLGFPGPKVPPVQIRFVLARDWTWTPDPTGEDGITYYTPTSCHLKKKHQKRIYATTTQAMQQQSESLRQSCYMKNKFCLLLSFVYLFYFALLGVGIWLV